MPANFGEIADYHHLMAARYVALAQTAREQGDIATANYHAGQAARYVQAAREQRIAMTQAPGGSIEAQRPRRWSPEPKRVPPAPGRLLTVLRGAGHLAAAIRQSISGRSDDFDGMSLR
jgi:hypothetical protein